MQWCRGFARRAICIQRYCMWYKDSDVESFLAGVLYLYGQFRCSDAVVSPGVRSAYVFFIFCIGKERTVIQCDRDRQRWHTHKQTWRDVDRWHMHGLCCKIGTAVPLQHEIPDDLAYILRHEMAPCYSRVKPGGVKWFIKWVGFVRLKTNSS